MDIYPKIKSERKKIKFRKTISGDVSNCPHAGQRIHPFVSLPFGYGRRMCIGRRFAENELHILVAKVIKNNHKTKVFYERNTSTSKRGMDVGMFIIYSLILCILVLFLHLQFFRKYKIEYHYGKLTYKVNPTYIPEQPLKFRLTEREN